MSVLCISAYETPSAVPRMQHINHTLIVRTLQPPRCAVVLCKFFEVLCVKYKERILVHINLISFPLTTFSYLSLMLLNPFSRVTSLFFRFTHVTLLLAFIFQARFIALSDSRCLCKVQLGQPDRTGSKYLVIY